MKRSSIFKYRAVFCLTVFLSANISFFVTRHVYFWHNTDDFNNIFGTLNFTQANVLIYTATPFFGVPIRNSALKRCPKDVQKYCRVSSNPHHISQAKAVLFHSRDFDESKMRRFNTKYKRDPEKLYVMMAMENPFYADLHPYQHFFNWTMTYRTDSDVYYPYGGLVKRDKKLAVDYEEIWNSKSKSTLWLVSNTYNTGNRRKELVEKLVSKGLEVDLLGELYNTPPACPRYGYGKRENCDLELHKPYKFTIAFENHNCKDYVTEKFWRKAAQYFMVPIVMTRKIYTDIGIPDSMFLAVDDFPSLEEFISHVEYVSPNKTAYLQYHKWREEFRILEANEEHFGYCDLCRKLVEFEGKTRKCYEDVASWHGTSQCDLNSFADRYL